MDQTGSGKTYTMEGDVDNESLRGVIPRTLEALCSEMRSRSCVDYSIHISMIEIYNEKVYDLLSNNLQVEVRLNPDGHVILPSLYLRKLILLKPCKQYLYEGIWLVVLLTQRAMNTVVDLTCFSC